MGFLSSCNGLIGALTPDKQNGKSLLGTLLAPTLPLWIVGNGGNGGNGGYGGGAHGGPYPWGGKTVTGNNMYKDCPSTGVTRNYEWNITRAVIAPDGYEKAVILVNDQFPGPLVEANWGDWIEVKVNNLITDPEEGTAIHWHGLLQEGTPFMDGVPGVSQCPIAPSRSFTYKFQASLYGSSWYHSHYSAQYSGGLYGPLVVYGPSDAQYDIDVGPIMVGDWWHAPYDEVVDTIMAPGFTGRSFSDNNLIQGKMNFDCSTKAPGDDTPCTNNAGLAKFKFQSGKTHRLRFINSGSQGIERVSLDEHTMTVIANDFVDIEPYDTKVVTLGVGQRVDVLVKANAGSPTSGYWLRANLTSCSGANQPLAMAGVFYENADVNAIPTSKPWDVPDPGNCANDPLTDTVPSYKIALPEASWTHQLDIGTFVNETNNFLWTFGGVSARVDYNNPTLLQAKEGNFTFAPDMNVIDFGSNSSVKVIINNPTPAPHPIHAHGLNMYILDEGDGTYDGTTIVNSNNPMRRDVQNVRPFGYLAVQVDTTNTGVWPFHCHIAWHASAGFFSQFIFNPDGMDKLQFPDSMAQTCSEWADYTSRDVVDQVDSGL